MKAFSAHPWHLIGGLTIWAAWFVVMYGGLSVACELYAPAAGSGVLNWISLLLLLLTLLTCGYLVVCAAGCWRGARAAASQKRFTLKVGAAVYLSSALATLAVGLPVGVISPCM